MKRLIERLLCTASIFLCATFSSNAQAPSAADVEALRLERMVYAAASPEEHNEAVWAKYEVRKSEGLYREALAELSRLYTYALDDGALDRYYTQKALCSYLVGDFDISLATISEAQYYIVDPSSRPLLLLIEALAAGEKGEWKRSESAAVGYLDAVGDDGSLRGELEELYRRAPKMRNPMVAWWLSLVPGLGQLYAGEVWSGLVSFVANGALGLFGATEMVGGHWLSGWVVGCGGLSTTYFVGQERARMLTERRNRQLLRDHNDLLRQLLLDDH